MPCIFISLQLFGASFQTGPAKAALLFLSLDSGPRLQEPLDELLKQRKVLFLKEVRV